MRAFILLSCAALAVSACNRADDTGEANVLAEDNMMVDENAMLDPAMNADANLADTATNNLIEQDLTTNDADTNLANGM